MKETLFTKFKNWICATFGHKFHKEGTMINGNPQGWKYGGHHHRNCKRCGRVISTPYNPK